MSLKGNGPIRIMFLHTGAELYGADQILFSIVKNLDKETFEPIVVLPNDGPLVNKLRAAKVRTEIMPYPIIRRRYFNAKGAIEFVRSFIRDSGKLRDFAKKEHVDIVHNNTVAVLEGIYLKRKLKIKLVSHVHEMIAEPKIIARFLYRAHLKNCDKMIVVSGAVKKHIEKVLKVVSGKIVVVHNGISAPKNAQKSDAAFAYYKEFDLPKTAKIAAFVGRINAIKGQDDFIEAVGRIASKDSNVYGLIIGDAFSGQEWRVDALKKNIKEKGLEKNIIYCGFRSDIERMYQIFDVLILSSVKYDSFPTVVLEAMSEGVPTVAYRCGGVEEMIKDGYNGFLVKQGDIGALGEKAKEILGNNSKLQMMRNNSKKYFEENFTLKKFIYNLSVQYKEVLR